MAEAKTVKIKLDIDAQDAIKTSQQLKQQLNDMFKDDGNLGHSLDGLIQQMQVLTQHVDHVTANLGSMSELLKSVSNGTSAGINAQALQTQNAQYQEQLRLLTQMNSQMQLLLNQERQQRSARSGSGNGVGADSASVEDLRARLTELNAEYARLEGLSQTCADQLASMGEEGAAAMASWAAEVANAGPELEDFNDIVENIKKQFADSGMPMSDATEQVLRQWAAIANQMVDVDSEASRIGNTLNSNVVPAGNRVLNMFNRMATSAGRALNAVSVGLRRTGTFLTSLSRAASRLRSVFTGIFRIITSLGRGAIGIFSRLTAGLHETNKAAQKTHGSFGQLFKTVLATVLGIKGLSATISSIKSIASEGLQSLGQSFADIKNQLDSMEIAWTNFKASIVSIVQPIYSLVQPALAQLVTWITNIMNTIAKFVAAFTGQSFIYKGVATAAKGTGKAAKKATEDVKELVKQLQGFDELNNLTSQKEKEAADTGGGGGGMFDNVKWEKEPVPDWIKDWVAKIKDILKQLFEPLKKAWERMGYWVMSSWKFALEEVWKLVKSIGSAFLKAWNLGTVQKIFEDLLFVVGAIGRGIGVIALKFREVWEEDERGVRLFESIFKLIQKITEQLKFLAADTLNWLARIELRPLFDSLLKVLDDMQTPIETLARIVRKFIVNVVYKYVKWLIEKGLPKLLDIFDRFIQKIDWSKFENNITKLFDPFEHALEEVSDGLLDFIDQVAQEFGDFLNSDEFESATDKIAEFFNNINSEDVLNGLNYVKDTISGFFKQVKEDVEQVWNSEPVQKFISWLKGKDGDPETLGRNIAKVVEAIAGFMILSTIAGLFAPFITLLSQAIGLISGVGGLLESLGLIGPAATTAAGEVTSAFSSSSFAATGHTLGGTIAAAIVAGFAGAEVGKSIGAAIFPDDAELYEHYDGIIGTLNLIKDTAVAAKDAVVMAIDAFRDWRDGGDEVAIMNQNLSREIREGFIPTEDELQSRLEDTGARYSVVRDNMDDLTQKVLDANPQLQELKDSFNDAGIAIESLDSITQIAVGLDTFNQNGGNATATVQTLADTFGEADEYAQYFFEELANGNATFQEAVTGYTQSLSDMNLKTEEFVAQVHESVDNGLPTYEEMMGHGTNMTEGLSEGWKVGLVGFNMLVPSTMNTSIIGPMQTLFDMHSPSVLMENMGANIVQGLIDGWEKTIPQMLTVVTNFGGQFANAFTSVKAKVVEVFKSMGTAIMNVLKNILNSISQAVKSATSSMQYLQNLNTSNIGRRSSISTPSRIPKLAQGAVIPPNKEFMAVLGDQSYGTNIETPLSTMVDAFNQAGGNRSEQEITLMQEQNQLLRQLLEKEWSISSSQMLSAMQRQAVVYTKQSGKPAF